MGVTFTGDHIAVQSRGGRPGELTGPHPKIWCWSDDADDWGGAKWGTIATLRPLKQDATKGGAWNADITIERFSTPMAHKPGVTGVRDWGAGWEDPPAGAVVSHGAWLGDEIDSPQWLAHKAVRSVRGYDEYLDGVPEEEIIDDPDTLSGKRLRDQREAGRWSKAKGTRTFWYLYNVAEANGNHTANTERLMQSWRLSGTTTFTDTISANGEVSTTHTTDTFEPDEANWPSGNYRMQYDITAIHIDLEFGALTLSADVGHFAKTNAAVTSEVAQAQTESAFRGTGLHMATTGTWDPAAGLITDRFEVTTAVHKWQGHGADDITYRGGGTNNFADGPWTDRGNYEQAAFQGQNDDGTDETDATDIAAVNTNWSWPLDGGVFRTRIRIEEENTGHDGEFSMQMQYRRDPGGGYGAWGNLAAASQYLRSITSAVLSDTDDTTRQLGGTKTYIADNNAVDTNGTESGNFGFVQNNEVEVVIVMAYSVTTPPSVGDKLQVRIIHGGNKKGVGGVDATFDTYTQTPEITVTAAAAAGMEAPSMIALA